ncbi:hypothetical protein HDV00_007230 [Rhizophlyctis rosea]|nr:hypothetical protein HDV00_007230 [Rhizophlyctis rosea]
MLTTTTKCLLLLLVTLTPLHAQPIRTFQALSDTNYEIMNFLNTQITNTCAYPIGPAPDTIGPTVPVGLNGTWNGSSLGVRIYSATPCTAEWYEYDQVVGGNCVFSDCDAPTEGQCSAILTCHPPTTGVSAPMTPAGPSAPDSMEA